jgi:hypothetical protein
MKIPKKQAAVKCNVSAWHGQQAALREVTIFRAKPGIWHHPDSAEVACALKEPALRQYYKCELPGLAVDSIEVDCEIWSPSAAA